METEPITIHVSPDVARSFREATDSERARLEALIRFNLTHHRHLPSRSIEEIMCDASEQARANGLTESDIADLLRDE